MSIFLGMLKYYLANMFLFVCLVILFMDKPSKKLLIGPNNEFILTTKPFSRATRAKRGQFHSFRITIRGAEEPFSSALDEELRFFAECLGLADRLSSEKSAFRLFREIVLSSKRDFLRSSTDLADAIGLSRTATINQLNNMAKTGLVVKRGNLYGLRSKSMLRTIEEIEQDMDRLFEKLKRHAELVDRETIGGETP